MSQYTGEQCDGCGKRVPDRYLEIGWIHLEGADVLQTATISRSAGRRSDGHAMTDYLAHLSDFCSLDCLKNALDKAANERDGKREEQHCPRCGK